MAGTEWTDDLMAGHTQLAIAEARIREIALIANRASTELGCARSCLMYGYADKESLEALRNKATEIMLAADKLASAIADMREEVVQ